MKNKKLFLLFVLLMIPCSIYALPQKVTLSQNVIDSGITYEGTVTSGGESKIKTNVTQSECKNLNGTYTKTGNIYTYYSVRCNYNGRVLPKTNSTPTCPTNNGVKGKLIGGAIKKTVTASNIAAAAKKANVNVSDLRTATQVGTCSYKTPVESTTDSNIHLNIGQYTGSNGETAYCLDPGIQFSPGEYVLVESYDMQEGNNATLSKIIQAAKDDSNYNNYAVIETALRLASSKNQGSGYCNPNQGCYAQSIYDSPDLLKGENAQKAKELLDKAKNGDVSIEPTKNDKGQTCKSITSKIGIYEKTTANSQRMLIIEQGEPECGYFCEIKDGKYYGKDGEEVTEETYKAECENTICMEKDGKYYGKDGREVTEEQYEIECSVKDKCNLNTKGSPDCSNNSVIEDPEMCSIIKENASEFNKTKDYGNDYCEIYCRESVTLSFDSIKKVLAGRYFQHSLSGKSQIKNLSSVITGTRECTSIIDYDSWKEAYKSANDSVLSTWNALTIAKAKAKIAEETKKEAGPVNCTACGGYECTETYCIRKDNKGKCIKEYTSTWKVPRLSARTIGKWYYYGPGTKEYNETSGTANKDYTFTTVINTILSTSYQSGSSAWNDNSCSCSGTSYCSNDEGIFPSTTAAQNAYSNALNKRTDLINKILACNFASNSSQIANDFTIGNELSADYDENVSFGEGYNVQMKNEDVSPEVVETKYSDTNKWDEFCGGCYNKISFTGYQSENLIKWQCSGELKSARCLNEGVDIPKNKLAYIKTKSENEHYQSTEFATQVFTGTVSDNFSGSSWLKLPSYSWPVSANRKNGIYNIYYTINSFTGLNNSKLTNKLNGSEVICNYEVVNELNSYDCDDGYHECYECPDGVNCNLPGDDDNDKKDNLGVFFRTINLEDVFPNSITSSYNDGKVHSSRVIGYNWNNQKGIEIIKEIQKLGDNIWTNSTPQYKITLTPSTIREIKQYNKNSSYLDNSTLNCTGVYCTSSFLKDLEERLGDKVEKNTVKEGQVENALYEYRRGD